MKFLQRKAYEELKKQVKEKEITLLLGPRQAGKTTLMFRLKEELKQKKIPTYYFNLDLFEEYQYFKSQHQLLEKIKREIGTEKGVVFIDEIQRLKNAGFFLKGLYDLFPPYKFIVSGSGSIELKANILEPMTGRKKIIYCLPLSFEEFCANKLEIGFEKVSQCLKTEPFKRERLIEEYFQFGGYPKLFFKEKNEEKMEVLREIYQSYIEKDVRGLLKVEKDYLFDSLLRVLASSVGNLVNINELSLTLGSHIATIKKYLFLLEKTFIIELLPPYFANVRVEIKKMPKVYFLDLGLLNYLRGETRRGAFFENACFLSLKEKYSFEKLYFWRTKTGAEVDFVIEKGLEVIPVEVKEKFGRKLGKSLISFLTRYQPKIAYLLEKDGEKEEFYYKKTKIVKKGFWDE